MTTHPKDVTQSTAPSWDKSMSPSPSHDSPQSQDAENVAPTESRVYVEWILPTQADNKTKDTSDAITQFAPIFSNRPWSLTNTPPLTVRGPPLRSPSCTNKGLRKTLTTGGNKSSKYLLRLFTSISQDTHTPVDTSRYSRTAFDGAFRDDFAVVASESSANPIVTLDRDYDATVTLRHESEPHEDASIRFIRRSPPGSASDESGQHEYFITAPSQLRLTVNGQTYTAEEGQTLVVGPLRGLSIIELLSQPIFFYRNEEHLNISKATGAKATVGEMRRRDQNGEMQQDQVDVIWTPIEAAKDDTPLESPQNPPNDGPVGPQGTQNDTPSDPQDENKRCEALRRRLDELLGNEDISRRLDSFRDSGDVTDDPGQWLLDQDVIMAIATVTLAITGRQQINEGFSILSVLNVGNFQRGECQKDEIPSIVVSRYCRPLLFPIFYGNHIVLALVQLDDEGQLTFSVFDSKYMYYTMQERRAIFEKIMTIVEKTHWWANLYPTWEDVPKPTTAHLIPCAQQPYDSECGYYCIIFAWALALGLELNPHAAPIWNRRATGNANIYQTLLDISHLARLGLVDWELIYDFLRCHHFVLDETVPANRQFDATVPLEESAQLEEILRDLVEEDVMHLSADAYRMDDIRGSNFIRLPSGINHTNAPDYANRTQEVDHDLRFLSNIGRLRFGITVERFRTFREYFPVAARRSKDEGQRTGRVEAEFFLRSLQRTEGTVGSTSHERMFTWYRQFLTNKRSEQLNGRLMQLNPCTLAGQGLGRLRAILDNKDSDHVRLHFANALPENLVRQPLNLGEINIAIAAVVEAINCHQVNLHRGNQNPFTGGFALTTSDAVEMARLSSMREGSVSRPRRCFMLPMTISGQEYQQATGKAAGGIAGRAHHFLAVIQEEQRTPNTVNRDKSHFVIRTLDSAPWALRDDDGQSAMKRYIYNAVRNTAMNLRWHEQRNNPVVARFRGQHDVVNVFTQQRGRGWQCGMHTILYAWILALGLTPSEETVDLENDFYDELELLIRSAVAGLLDWQTLVAWLFCRGVTTSRELNSVPESRRFALSVYQNANYDANGGLESEKDLKTRLRQVFEEERGTVATMTEDELPYDFSNNVAFPDDTPGKISGGTAGESSGGPSGGPSRNTPREAPEEGGNEESGNEGGGSKETGLSIDDLGYAPDSIEYEVLKNCTSQQLEEYKSSFGSARQKLFEDFQMQGFELPRTIEDCGVQQRGTLKRKADSSSEWSCDGGNSLSPCKRYRLI